MIFEFTLILCIENVFFILKVALWTLCQLVESTGYVVEPYKCYPTLLDVLLNFLKTEQTINIRREVGASDTIFETTSICSLNVKI